MFTLFQGELRASEKTELCSSSPTERGLAYYQRDRQKDKRRDRQVGPQTVKQTDVADVWTGKLVHNGIGEGEERQMVNRQKASETDKQHRD